MTLGLIEEFLLLSLEDEGGEFADIPETSLSCGIAGAALMDLALRGKIDSDLTRLWAVDNAPTESASLNHILAQIVADPLQHHPKVWITRLAARAPQLRSGALAELCARGILREEDATFLWTERDPRYPVEKTGARLEGKKRVLALLFNDDIPDPRDVALIAIADACSIFERILSPSTLRDVRPRIDQLTRLDLIGAEIARTAKVMDVEISKAERRTVIAGLAGNVMEWYDFSIYGFFAAAIGAQFFPADNPATSLLASFGVFAVGFIGRPLGALLFGWLGDSHSRKSALMLSVVVMTIPTLLMGLMPTYAQIGIAAPILLVALRFCQGLAVGGEFTTSIVLMVEAAQRSRRGYVGSFAPFGAVGGMLLGSIIGGGLNAALTPEDAASWGWRAAFLIGMVLGLVVFIIRHSIPVDQTVTAVEAIEDGRRSPIALAFKTQWRTILRIVAAAQGSGFYFSFVYLVSWMSQNAGIAPSTALMLNGITLAMLLVFLPMAGSLSDRIGRKPLMLVSSLGMALFTWPLLWAISLGSIPLILACQIALALMQAGIIGAIPAFMVEALPRHVRCTALSIGQNLAQAIFGGTLPLIAVYLIASTGQPLAPALYVAAAAVMAFVVIATTHAYHEDEAAPARIG